LVLILEFPVIFIYYFFCGRILEASMNFEITEAVQSAINPGAVKDIYYYGETNTSKQAFPVVKNNRFKLEFANLGQGTSQFVISPNMGVSDVLCRFKLPAGGGSVTYTNASLAKGWAYSLIRTISVRYGGSSQYFWTGSQMLAQNLLDSENEAKATAMLELGGTFAVGTDCSGAEAYIYINLPHNSPRAEGKPLPFPSDLLTQPIVCTIELNSIASIFGGSNSLAPTGLPTQLDKAEFQVNQEYMSDSADLLARRVDMNTHAISVPLKYFAQQEVLTIFNANSPANQQVILSGFRAGEVRDILMWLEVRYLTGNRGQTAQWSWPGLEDVELRYNGEVFFTAPGGSSQLWNLIEDKKRAGFEASDVNVTTNPATDTGYMSRWTLVKFSQVDIPRDRMYDLLSGKPILNAVINVSLNLPSDVLTNGVVTANTQVVLHAVYMYNASILCSRGTSEYIF
jgi:hypothetical protein